MRKEIVDAGVAAGYRMFDTAQYYGTEKEVGDALSTCGLSREEMFITTKIYSISNSFELAQEAVDVSLKNLKTDYIDLMLVHAPYPEGTERLQDRSPSGISFREEFRLFREHQSRQDSRRTLRCLILS